MGAPFRVPPCNGFYCRLMHRFLDTMYRIPLSTSLSPRVVCLVSLGTGILISGNSESHFHKESPQAVGATCGQSPRPTNQARCRHIQASTSYPKSLH